MSTVETKTKTEAPERALLVREFVAAGLEVEGRMVDVRLVPFGEVARVQDAWDPEPYEEEWMPGVFDHQLNAANRVHARYGHSPHVVDVVGHGTQIRSQPDGYHVTAKIHNTVQGETALELLRDGALPCVSLEARPMKSVRTAAGVVQRIKANLTGFAFCREGAFVGAQVLAIREKEELIDEELLPVGMDPGVVERLLRLGLAVPDRYKAHPAEDTSAEADTSKSAPAAVDKHNTEES
jgi:HK97 family phage prohead protease